MNGHVDTHTHAFQRTHGGDWLCYEDGIRRTSQPLREELRDPPPERLSYDPDADAELVDSAFEEAFDPEDPTPTFGAVKLPVRPLLSEPKIEDVPAGPLELEPGLIQRDADVLTFARRSDPETSHAAADAVRPQYARAIRELIGEILDVKGPLTDEEIYRELSKLLPIGDPSPSGARTRRSELVKAGDVEYAGYTRTLSTGREGRVWRLRRSE